MPSTTFSSVFIVLDSSTVITPSLPTFSIASAISLPMISSPAEMDATCAMSCLAVDRLGHRAQRRNSRIRRPSECRCLQHHGVRARGNVLHALADRWPAPAGWRWWCRRRPRRWSWWQLRLTSCAPMFSKGSSSSISLAMVTPSLVMRGAPNFLSSTTLRPFGTQGDLYGIGQSVQTGFSSARRASSPNLICLAITINSFFNQIDDGE